MARKSVAAALAVVAGAAAAVTVPAPAQAAPVGNKDVTAVMFEWNFASVAKECTDTLGPAGYGYVQVSPPNERVQGSQWWTAYQPVSYKIATRLGDRAAFKSMVETCHAAGVKVVADTVINHMANSSGTGTGGSTYSKYDYPGTYSGADMDDCRTDITDYRDRWNVQHCEMGSLPDLDTGEEYVRKTI
jgi:alpha-amylase